MKKIKKIFVLVSCAAFMLAGLTAADEVTDLIKQGEKAYTEKQFKASIKFLNQAAARIQNLLAEKLASFLPGEIDGWKRGEVKKETLDDAAGEYMLFAGFFSAHVTYQKTDGPETVKVIITNAPQLTQMAKIPMELIKNPFFKQMSEEDESGEKVDAYTIQGMDGYKRTAQETGEADIYVFQGDVMLQVEGKKITKAEGLERFVKQSDLAGIKNFAGAP
jgi:hypothetical protein